jgi:gluconokinase
VIVVVWGVSGCGKSTIGRELAARMECDFVDADDHHPAANREKMTQGIPLSDNDREPWLCELRELLAGYLIREQSAVLACSALKLAYRREIGIDEVNIVSVLLSGSFELIQERLSRREHAFMNNDLLETQFNTLEPSTDGKVVNISSTPNEIVESILAGLE